MKSLNGKNRLTQKEIKKHCKSCMEVLQDWKVAGGWIVQESNGCIWTTEDEGFINDETRLHPENLQYIFC